MNDPSTGDSGEALHFRCMYNRVNDFRPKSLHIAMLSCYCMLSSWQSSDVINLSIGQCRPSGILILLLAAFSSAVAVLGLILLLTHRVLLVAPLSCSSFSKALCLYLLALLRHFWTQLAAKALDARDGLFILPPALTLALDSGIGS